MPLLRIGACCRTGVAALLLLAACAGDRKVPALLEVGSRFIDEHDARASSCAIGDQIRPALDCPAPVRLLARKAKISAGHLRRVVRIPLELRRGPLLISAEVRPAAAMNAGAATDDDEKETVRPVSVLRSIAKAGPTFDLEMAVPGDWDGRTSTLVVDALTPPPAVREARTTVAVQAGAQLSFGLGLASPSQAAVDFTISAQSATRRETLLEARLTPNAEGRADWKNQRIDLSSFTGEAVEIRYRAEVVNGGGTAFPVWGDPQLLVPAQGEPKNLILISFDTLRADALGAYGNELGASPAIDRFAQQGALLTSTQAPFPATWASHLSLMTGVYPPVHGVILQRNGGRLPEGLPTLAERLAAAHYQTAAVTENGYILPEAGFARGVSYYLEYSPSWNAGRSAASHRETSDPASLATVDATFGRAARWIQDHGDEVFFLFLHTYQVHFPYDPPAEHDVYTEPEERGRALELSADSLFEPEERRDYAAVAKKAYSGEVRFADTEFARLLARLDEQGLRDRTIIIVTSDHGEAFDEHGDLFHESLYDEVLHVPLLVRAPGLVPAGGRFDGPASLVDVVPTALDLMGLPVPLDVQGANLGPALRGEASIDPDRAVFAIDRTKKGEVPRVAVRSGATKWIEKRDGQIEVYDLDRDPGEQRNLVDPNLAAQGRARIDAFRRDAAALRTRLAGTDVAVEESPTIGSEREQKLRALGYVD